MQVAMTSFVFVDMQNIVNVTVYVLMRKEYMRLLFFISGPYCTKSLHECALLWFEPQNEDNNNISTFSFMNRNFKHKINI